LQCTAAEVDAAGVLADNNLGSHDQWRLSNITAFLETACNAIVFLLFLFLKVRRNKFEEKLIQTSW
jgi:hypothetical protein